MKQALSGGNENPAYFDISANAAVDAETRLPDAVLAHITSYVRRVGDKSYLDQTHPHLWFAEDILSVFPRSKFLGLIRDPRAVVALMLEHKGVQQWFAQAENRPFPNPFPGMIDYVAYEKLTLVEECCLRIRQHYQRIEELRDRSLPIMIVEFDALVLRKRETLTEILAFTHGHGTQMTQTLKDPDKIHAEQMAGGPECGGYRDNRIPICRLFFRATLFRQGDHGEHRITDLL